MVRAIGAVVAGILVGALAMLVIAFIGGLLFPSTTPIDTFNADQAIAAFPGLPTGAKAFILLSWFGAGLFGAWVAKLIERRSWAAWTIGAIFAVYVLITVFILPMPGWLQVLAVVSPIIGALIANHLVANRAVHVRTESDPRVDG